MTKLNGNESEDPERGPSGREKRTFPVFRISGWRTLSKKRACASCAPSWNRNGNAPRPDTGPGPRQAAEPSGRVRLGYQKLHFACTLAVCGVARMLFLALALRHAPAAVQASTGSSAITRHEADAVRWQAKLVCLEDGRGLEQRCERVTCFSVRSRATETFKLRRRTARELNGPCPKHAAPPTQSPYP